MLARPMVPAERMTDIFDRAATLNFTTVARVRGELTAERLTEALRRLERRHPLLSARIAREPNWSLLPGEAAPIPLRTSAGGDEAVRTALEASVGHRLWDDEGPRGELTWVQHEPRLSTLLLCLHHVVSDGSSGILAMRDLLALLDPATKEPVEELPSPGQVAFFPPLFEELEARVRAELARGMPPPKGPLPFRLREVPQAPMERRRARITALCFSVDDSEALFARARAAGATVHGLLAAGLSLALAQEPSASPLQRIAHPVSLRRYLRAYFPETPAIGDRVGYYVSAVNTDHTVLPTRELDDLAREISQAVQRGKADHEPLISAPIRGPLFAERALTLGLDGLREMAEQKVFTGSYGISNLGSLEKLGVTRRVGELELEDMYFALAGSVMNSLGAAIVCFDGRLTVQLTHVEPLVSASSVERLTERMRALLSGSARAEQS